jgi:hypothetical protein
MHYIWAETMARRDLGLTERFILFGIERIRLCRESSSSHTATEMIASPKRSPRG